MPDILKKTVADSKTSQVQIVMPSDSNGHYRLFGGRLMEWIDVLAGIVSRRHANLNTTTIFVDNLHFISPARVNDTIVLDGCITYVGRTSMEVRVETFVESLDGARALVNRAYIVLVAIDERGYPTEVPGLLLLTDEEKSEWEAGKERSRLRKSRPSS